MSGVSAGVAFSAKAIQVLNFTQRKVVIIQEQKDDD